MLKSMKRYTVFIAASLAATLFSSLFSCPDSLAARNGMQNDKTAYITIDDGPSRSITPLNLDTLKKYGVKATFFVLPHSGLDDIYERIVREGHVIGNHSYSHSYNYSSSESFKNDFVRAGNFIYKKTGIMPTVFRFPGGSVGRSKALIESRAGVLEKLGYQYYDWDVSLADTDPNLSHYGTEETIVNLLVNNVLKNTNNRKKLIILMHDSAGKIYSAMALPKIIEGLKKQGYTFDVLTDNGNWQFELNKNNESVITGYIGNDTTVSVPSVLGGRPVTSISSNAFKDDPIVSVSIPKSVVHIDSGAFLQCSTLKEINFSKGNPNYKSIDGIAYSADGKALFHYPADKTQPSGTFTVPNGVVIIGRCAFDHNQKLKKIILPDSVTQIEDSAFSHCYILKSFHIPSSVQKIGKYVFYSCNHLSAITVESENRFFKSIDGVLFDSKGSLLIQFPSGKSSEYTVPAGVARIGESAFRGSNGLLQVTLCDSVSSIEDSAFAYCEELLDVHLGSGLANIGSAAFLRCTHLRSIVVPDSLETIENNAFERCYALTDIYFTGEKPVFGKDVFLNVSGAFRVFYHENREKSWELYSEYPKKPFSELPCFNDVAPDAWYSDAVEFVAANHIASGMGFGRFCPSIRLTRGQLITMLMKAYSIDPDVNPADNFSDAGSDYYTGYLATAKRLSLSGGTGDNRFLPEKEITRQEMFALLYHVLETAGKLPQAGSGKSFSDFADADQVELWATDAMTLFVETGIIRGSGEKLNPTGTVSRAEMAQVLYTLLR